MNDDEIVEMMNQSYLKPALGQESAGVDIQPYVRQGVYSVFSHYDNEAILITSLGLLEIAQFVAAHPVLKEKAKARREEQSSE